jgi:hypothetical protein
MKRDLEAVSESKRAFRKRLAQWPIAEKLRMLDALRERTLAIRRASKSSNTGRAILRRPRAHQTNER